MSDEQQILPCVVCDQHHEQMLMLSCLHDPCINCAAIHYVQNAPKNSLFYPCSKCKEQTQLDSSSVVELQRVYRSLKPIHEEPKKYNYNRNISKETKQLSQNGKNSRSKLYQNTESYSYINSAHTVSDKYGSGSLPDKYDPYNKADKSSNYYPVNPNSSVNIKKTINPASLMCNEHPQDELTYFCFSCNKPICPQCAIHGSHREHQVQTTRRAIKQIKARLNEANEKLSSQIGHLMHKKQEGRKNLKDLADVNKKDHEQIKRQFNRLRNILSERQKQFLSIIAQNYERNCDETKFFSSNLDKLIQSYNVTRKNIDVTLKRDDLTVLQQFNRREDEALQILQRNSSLGEESKFKPPSQVNYQLFQQEMSELNSIFESMRVAFIRNKNQY